MQEFYLVAPDAMIAVCDLDPALAQTGRGLLKSSKLVLFILVGITELDVFLPIHVPWLVDLNLQTNNGANSYFVWKVFLT